MKLLEPLSGGAKSLNPDSSYSIMFGPDKCGMTNKIHFIYRYKNPVSGEVMEHHLQGTPGIEDDRAPHLYGFALSPTGDLDIMVDGAVVQSASLASEVDFSPPLFPPEEIDDPNDTKPDTWVDEEQIEDPNAKKPDDWDEDAPPRIPDPSVTKPDGDFFFFFFSIFIY